jgi:GDP-mannose 4,6-dehydratase
MRIVVTGATGFIGSHFIDLLYSDETYNDIVGFKRWRSPMDNVAHLPEYAVRWWDVDLCDLTAVREAIEAETPDTIIHFAAQSYVPQSYAAPQVTITTNVIGTLNLLEAVRTTCVDKPPRIILITSSEVYGNPNGNTMDERCPTRPISPYGVSKLAADALGYAYFKSYGMDIVRGRNFTTSGPRRGAPFFDSAWCRQIARMELKRQKPVLCVGNLDSVRTVMDVRDCVKAYLLLTLRGEAGQAYNIAGSQTFTLEAIVEILRGMTHVRFDLVRDETLIRPADVTDQRPLCGKFKKLTGWEPTIPYEQTLLDTLNHWRAHERSRVNA